MTEDPRYGSGWSYATSTLKRPLDEPSARKRFDAREMLVATFPVAGSEMGYVIHDPSVRYLTSGIKGWQGDARVNCSVIYTGDGSDLSVFEITMRSEIPGPETGRRAFWLLTVRPTQDGRHSASLDMTETEEKFFLDELISEKIDRVARERLAVTDLSDYAKLIRPDLIELAWLDLGRFAPGSPGVRVVRPRDVPPEPPIMVGM